MFEYQRHGRYFAQTAQGLEAAAAEELSALGAEDCRPVYRCVRFKASPRVLCRANYRARLAGHVDLGQQDLAAIAQQRGVIHGPGARAGARQRSRVRDNVASALGDRPGSRVRASGSG